VRAPWRGCRRLPFGFLANRLQSIFSPRISFVFSTSTPFFASCCTCVNAIRIFRLCFFVTSFLFLLRLSCRPRSFPKFNFLNSFFAFNKSSDVDYCLTLPLPSFRVHQSVPGQLFFLAHFLYDLIFLSTLLSLSIFWVRSLTVSEIERPLLFLVRSLLPPPSPASNRLISYPGSLLLCSRRCSWLYHPLRDKMRVDPFVPPLRFHPIGWFFFRGGSAVERSAQPPEFIANQSFVLPLL